MTTQKASPNDIVMAINEDIKIIGNSIADITLSSPQKKHVIRLAFGRLDQSVTNAFCESVIHDHKVKWLKNISSTIALSPVGLQDNNDINKLTNKIVLGLAIKAIGSTAPSFHDAETIFALLHNEKLDSNIKEALSRGLDEITDNLSTDIQMIIMQSHALKSTPLPSLNDFDCMAALNNYANAISLDKADVSDLIKNRAIQAINSAMTNNSLTMAWQCIQNTFMSNELILGDDWNNPAMLNPERIINEPQFSVQVKHAYQQAVMQEVNVALADLQPSTTINLAADFVEGSWREGIVLLKFDEDQTYEVWDFQFDDVEQLRFKIITMASNEISEIENKGNQDSSGLAM